MRWAIFLTAALVTLALDQSTKFLAERFLPVAPRPLTRSWSLRHALNRDHLFIRRRSYFLLLWLATVLLTLLWLNHSALEASPLACGALGAALGGCTGNTFDRISRGGVIDFIALPRVSLFNLADLAIVAAAALLGHNYLLR